MNILIEFCSIIINFFQYISLAGKQGFTASVEKPCDFVREKPYFASNQECVDVDSVYAIPTKNHIVNKMSSEAIGIDGSKLELASPLDESEEKGNHEDVEDIHAKKHIPTGWEKHEGETN